jgi:hypothetical protein
MLWRVSSRPTRTRSKPPGFILPCQLALAELTRSAQLCGDRKHEVKSAVTKLLLVNRQHLTRALYDALRRVAEFHMTSAVAVADPLPGQWARRALCYGARL